MCLQIFIASNKPLPVIPFDPAVPALCVRELWSEVENVCKQFSKPFVYDVATHEGCACAFGYASEDLDILTNPDVPEDIKQAERADFLARREVVSQLLAYLVNAVRDTGPVEMFTCWAGDEETEPAMRHVVTTDYFGGLEFHLAQKQFFTISLAERVIGLHECQGWVSDGFDNPLPDEFWLGMNPHLLTLCQSLSILTRAK